MASKKQSKKQPSKQSPKKTAKDATLPRLPRFVSTYSIIVERALQSVWKEASAWNKVRGFTREMVALGRQSKQHFNALPILGKVGVALLLMTFGGGIVAAGYFTLVRPDPDELRRQVQMHIDAQDFVGAKAALDKLRSVQGSLTEEEHWQLEVPVQAGIDGVSGELLDSIDNARQGKRWDEALEGLTKLEKLGVEVEWAVFTRAEVLRSAGRNIEAGEYYARYVKLFPNTEETDDALFWQALALKEKGQPAKARAALTEIIEKHPQSNFMTSTKRLLRELEQETSP